VTVLVATDIAARGIDIDQLPVVINFDLPMVAEDYVHRIGRTGRAGAEGQAISLVSHDESGLLRDIGRLLKTDLEVSNVPGFEPSTPLRMDAGAPRPKQQPRQPQASRNQVGQGRSGGGQGRSAGGGQGRSEGRSAGGGQGRSAGGEARQGGGGSSASGRPPSHRPHSHSPAGTGENTGNHKRRRQRTGPATNKA
jgi:ATP-dependent RNA helicase RhlE